jgi:hypothetical protein
MLPFNFDGNSFAIAFYSDSRRWAGLQRWGRTLPRIRRCVLWQPRSSRPLRNPSQVFPSAGYETSASANGENAAADLSSVITQARVVAWR